MEEKGFSSLLPSLGGRLRREAVEVPLEVSKKETGRGC